MLWLSIVGWTIIFTNFCQTEMSSDFIKYPQHPMLPSFFEEMEKCRSSTTYCDNYARNISTMSVRIATDLGKLHLDQLAIDAFEETITSISTCKVRTWFLQLLSKIYFSIGDIGKAQQKWSSDNLLASRSHAAQALLLGYDSMGLDLLRNYTSQLESRFRLLVNVSEYGSSSVTAAAASADEYENVLLSLLLNEALGTAILNIPLTDLLLYTSRIHSLGVQQRFYLAVGLAKLGLYDLSLKHVSQIATPWEAPLYTLRAQLIFSPVHASMRDLARSVNNFLQNGEAILLRKASVSSPLMTPLCNSFSDAALALQALPLLHLAGYSSPRAHLVLGQSPIALPMLLSEVFTSMCRIGDTSDALDISNKGFIEDMSARPSRDARTIRVGVVSGSFDGPAGQLMIGMLEGLSKANRTRIQLIAICFPTPRDAKTDALQKLFDGHINLTSNNKTEAVSRILALAPDILIFADAGLDSRVFTLAHERISVVQAALWGFGGSIGIPSVDYYFIPELLWESSKCPRLDGAEIYPQELLAEQVVLLEGMPPAQPPANTNSVDLNTILQSRFLLPDLNTVHVYLFPGTVLHLHPEFDAVIVQLLRSDPLAIVLIAVPRSGRDNLPTTHAAIRHDLMHPSNGAAAVHKLNERLRASLGSREQVGRIRVLPPLEGVLYQKLLRSVVAVLDPFPVGVHEPLLQALLSSVPVVSAPSLQECTNSHAYSLARHILKNETFASISWPSTVDEYVALSLRLQGDKVLRKFFISGRSRGVPSSHGIQIVDFLERLFHGSGDKITVDS